MKRVVSTVFFSTLKFLIGIKIEFLAYEKARPSWDSNHNYRVKSRDSNYAATAASSCSMPSPAASQQFDGIPSKEYKLPKR